MYIIKKGKMSKIAVFLILLVISIPFVIAEENGKILKVAATGKDGIPKIMSLMNDYPVVAAEVSLKDVAKVDDKIVETELPVDPAQVVFNFFGFPFKFTECNGGICTYTGEASTRALGEHEYTVTLNSKNGMELDSKTDKLIVDGIKPSISTSSMERISEFLVVKYKVNDLAYYGSSVCSGIKSVNILDGFNVKKEFTITNPACEIEENKKVKISELALEEGTHKLCLQAVDKVGLTSEISKKTCIDFVQDSVQPVVDVNSLSIRGRDYKKITHVSPLGINAVISVNITDENLDPDKVVGDFSSLNGVAPYMYKNVPAKCEMIISSVYLCKWPNVNLQQIADAAAVTITAADKSGNSKSETINTGLSTDDLGPTIIDLYNVESPEQQSVYLTSRGKNILEAKINEQGAGLSKQMVYLDLSSLGGQASVQATNCTNLGNEWLCTFEAAISAQEGANGRIAISSDSKDDAENRFMPYSKSVIVDNTAPLFFSSKISPDCPTSLSGLELEINLNELSPTKINASTRGVSDVNSAIGECDVHPDNDVYQQCFLSVSGLYSTHIATTVEITAKDAAGNILRHNVPVEVCEPVEKAPPNLVSVSVGSAPKVDKKTLSFIEIPLPISLDVYANGKVLSKTASCEQASSVTFLDENSGSEIMIVRLKQQSVEAEEHVPTPDESSSEEEIESLAINCSISFFVKDNAGRYYTEPEVETFTITVPLYGNPLGTIDEAIQTKIDDTKKQIDDVQSRIDGMNIFNMLFGGLCDMAEAAGIVNAAWQTGKATYYAIACPSAQAAKETAFADAAAVLGCLKTTLAGTCAAAATIPIYGQAVCAPVCVGEAATLPATIATAGSLMVASNPATPAIPPEFAVTTATTLETEVTALSAAGAACPVAAACIPLATTALASATTWEAVEKGWQGLCTGTSFHHNFVDSYIWTTGYVGPPAGMFVKISCMVLHDCALVDMSTLVDVTASFAESYGATKVSGAGGLGESAGTTTTRATDVEKVEGGGILWTKTEKVQIAGRKGLSWGEASSSNALSASSTSGSYISDPFRRLTTAYWSLCLPAMQYGWEKERQITCMKKTCIERNAEAGLPIDICEQAYKERECIYVDPPFTWDFDAWQLLYMLPGIIAGIAWRVGCSEYLYVAAECDVPGICIPGESNVLCAITGVAITSMEVLEAISKGRMMFQQEKSMTGTDFCSGGSSASTESAAETGGGESV